MFFLCGHRSSGKSVTGKILKDKGYWVFDVGPFIRKYYKKNNIENLSLTDFIKRKESENKNPDWMSDFLKHELNKQYKRGCKNKKDLVIIGFRSMNDIRFFEKKLQKITFSKDESKIVFMETELQLALKRFLNRKKNNQEKHFWEQINYEKEWGIEKIKERADVIIDNNSSINNLLKKIDYYFDN
ncbi:MAG: hypothetical protein PHH88_01865 [Candidatus Pacebacteria bacterium]|nr:hypothetical protein [Candidatus Paceibacterota bacterium]